MKNLLSIIFCILLLLGTTNLGAVSEEVELEDQEYLTPTDSVSAEFKKQVSTASERDFGPAVDTQFIQTQGQQSAENYCENQTRIIIAETATLSARHVLDNWLDNLRTLSSQDVTLCFDFDEPIALDTPLVIYHSGTGRVRLVDMEFRRGAAAGPLLQVKNPNGSLFIHNINISGIIYGGTASASPAESCLNIVDSQEVVVRGGRFEGCVFGVHITNSHNITLGAPHHLLIQAEGNFIGNNLSKGVYVENSENVSLGSNDYQRNISGNAFDYYNAVVLENSNLGVQPPKRIQGELTSLAVDNYYKYYFAGLQGIIQFYLIEGVHVMPLASCDVGEDHICKVLKGEMVCTENALVTAIYTNANGASSEFMVPEDCENWVDDDRVMPSGEVVIATPEPSADVEVELDAGSGSGMTGMAAKKMCTLMANAPVAYTPLMWLFLSVGVLGGVRLRRRK